jgi:hypothetical protein
MILPMGGREGSVAGLALWTAGTAHNNEVEPTRTFGFASRSSRLTSVFGGPSSRVGDRTLAGRHGF